MNKEQKLVKARPSEVARSLTNPRGRDFTKSPDWPEFVASVRTHGVQQPPLVRPLPAGRKDANGAKWELVAGERRWTAAIEAKLETFNVLVADLAEGETIEIQQIENLQRADLSALEEAQGFADWRDALLKSKAVATVVAAVDHICGKIHKKRSHVFSRLALLKLSGPVAAALASGKIDASKASLIAQVIDAAGQKEVLEEATHEDQHDSPMSYRQLKEHIEKHYRITLRGAEFDLAKVYVVDPKDKTAPIPVTSCQACPKRTGNMPAVEGGDPSVCTDPECFRWKLAQVAKEKPAAQMIVMTAAEAKKAHYGNDYVEDDASCYQDPKYRKWKDILGKLAPSIHLAVDRHRHDGVSVRKYYLKAEAVKIINANKLISNQASKPSKADLAYRKQQEARRAKEAEKEKQMGSALNVTLGVAAGYYKTGGLLPFVFWKNLAKTAVLAAASQGALDDSVFTGRGMPAGGDDGTLFGYIDRQVTPENLIGLIVHVMVAQMSDYEEHGGEKASAMKLWGVDWQKVKAGSVAAIAKQPAAKAPKAKPAKIKPAKKTKPAGKKKK